MFCTSSSCVSKKDTSFSPYHKASSMAFISSFCLRGRLISLVSAVGAIVWTFIGYLSRYRFREATSILNGILFCVACSVAYEHSFGIVYLYKDCHLYILHTIRARSKATAIDAIAKMTVRKSHFMLTLERSECNADQ